MTAQRVKLQNLLRDWRCERRLNPCYEDAKIRCHEWTRSFNCFDARSQRAFDLCDFPRLAMMMYPHFDESRSRTGCNLMALFFVFDHLTDVEDEKVTRQMADITMDALRNPDKPRPAGECAIGEMARQFWASGRQTATPMAERHFIEAMQSYVDSVVLEAADRGQNRIRTLEDYLNLRFHTCGVLPSQALGELELEFPEDVYCHPLLQQLRDCGVLSVIAINDLYSYNAERARGEHAYHNLLTVVMYRKRLGLQEAVHWIGSWHDQVVRDFMEARANLPSWGPEIDTQVARYVEALEYTVRGVDAWSFETQRYFGTRGPEVQRTLELYMLPLIDLPSAEPRHCPSAPCNLQDTDADGVSIAALGIHNRSVKSEQTVAS